MDYLYSVCGDPSENLPRHASVSSLNGSVITFSCDPQDLATVFMAVPLLSVCQESGLPVLRL